MSSKSPAMQSPRPPNEIQQTLGLRPKNSPSLVRKLVMSLLLLSLLVGAAWFALPFIQPKESTPQFRTEPARTGALVVKVSATGNLEPTNQVDVGSELSGILEAVLVDDNASVQQGQVLARLDASRVRDQMNKSKAALTSSQAQVAVAVATVSEARSQMNRLRELSKRSNGQMVSGTELSTAEATLARAIANESVARAGVEQAEATLHSDETNLEKTVIRSPINGVVLARKVEPGQTVAASLQAPVLFTLAEDLTRMKLEVAVDEADVGQVKVGQDAVFTVDAWRNRRYPAKVTRVNFGSGIKDGVVSYPTVLEVDNDDQSLRPGMTATAEITTLNRENVLLIPNAALRFTPNAQSNAAPSASLVSSLVPKMPRSGSGRGQKEVKPDGMQTVYVLRAGKPVAVEINVGVTDGKSTEVLGGEIQAGDALIVEQVNAKP